MKLRRLLCCFGLHAYGQVQCYSLNPGDIESVLGWLGSPDYWRTCSGCGKTDVLVDWREGGQS